jgi:nucleoside-diphosphate-sugar epimerase
MSKKLLLITGATGFIGSHVLDRAIKAGYNIRLTVRKAAQINELKQLFPSASNQLDFIAVPNITVPDAFNKAVNGVDYVLHLASPMPLKGEDLQQDYVDPAVKGTLSILNGALQSTSVKRVTIMASVLSIMPMGGLAMKGLVLKGTAYIFVNHTWLTTHTENSNEPHPVDLNMSFPDGVTGHALKYQASKILAHDATLKFIKDHNPSFKVITVHPTFVLGHSLIQKSAQEISGGNYLFMGSLSSKQPMITPQIVDVRDVADTMLATINAEIDKNGEEFIINGKPTSWDAMTAFVKFKYPQVPVNLEPPFESGFEADGAKAEKYLGAKWLPMEDIIGSLLDQQLAFKKS